MFKYEFKTKIKILAPFCNDFRQIKHKVISSTPECIRTLYVYPNGFVLEVFEYADKIILVTNRQLTSNDDGTIKVQW